MRHTGGKKLVLISKPEGTDMDQDRDNVVYRLRYGLDGPGIESHWGGGARFSAPVHTGPGAHPPSYTMRTGS
jgi:hypothetical protein